MDCTDCGACCIDQYIRLTEEEVRAARPEEVQGSFLRKIDGHCIRFDPLTRKCKDYENRPAICRKFPPGCMECVLIRLSFDDQFNWFDGSRTPIRFSQGCSCRGRKSYEGEYDKNKTLVRFRKDNPTPREAEVIARANACLPAAVR